MNLNTKNYENLNNDFEEACSLCRESLSHSEMIQKLKVGNVVQKQYAALVLDKVENDYESDILLSNLTGCDGKIREAVALKINEILNSDKKAFELLSNEKYAEKYANSTIDINGNICRLTIDNVKILASNNNFVKAYSVYILKFIQEAFEKLDSFIFRDKKYVINKQIFKLYWALEALKIFYDIVSEEELYKILKKASSISEYTIREKTAQIVLLIQNPKFDDIKQKLKDDENYYVKKVIRGQIL
jgi:hypothetical protein